MGKLFDYIKFKYQNIKNFENILKEDKNAITKFNLYYRPAIDIEYISSYVNYISNVLERLNPKMFNEFLNEVKDIIGENKKSIPSARFDKEIINYEEILNKLESKLNDKDIDMLINGFEKDYVNDNFGKPSHPFNDLINNLKSDLNSLNDVSLPKDDIIKSLDFANNILIVKKDVKTDSIIDTVSLGVDMDAKAHFKEFSNETGISLTDLESYDKGKRAVRFIINTPEKFDKFDNARKQKIKLSDEFKNKIIALDKYIENKSILKKPQYGETGRKEYGFLDWFKKANELKEELINNSKININDKELKIESFKKINNISKELENITNEYKDILDNIKSNFDLNKVGLPSNVYSGRPFNIDNNIEDYVPNLPEVFDMDDAAYGVLLNGYSQLKGFCISNGISLDKMLNDPLDGFFSACQNKADELDKESTLDLSNPLGKRMARCLIQPTDKYDIINKLGYGYRGLEFLSQAQDRDNNLNNNIILTSLSGELSHILDHSSDTLFSLDLDDNTDLKRLFAFGEMESNLLKVSSKYRNLIGDNNVLNYDDKINGMKYISPKDEVNRVINIIKDYMIERKYMLTHKNEFINDDKKFSESFEVGRMVLAAKEYFSDYVMNNDLDIQKIKNQEDRKLILDFINKPVMVLNNKLGNDPNIFIENKNENFLSLVHDYGTISRRIHKEDYKSFVKGFEKNNKKPNGYNTNKDIDTILRDNKGTKWEIFFKTTSPEYLALEDAIVASTHPNSSSLGDFRAVKYFAKKYLDYKLPSGKEENKLSKTSLKRVEFCRTLLKSLDGLESHNEISVNQSLDDIELPNYIRKIDNNITIDKSKEFQSEIKDEIDKENNKEVIMKDNEDTKEIIDVKKDL